MGTDLTPWFQRRGLRELDRTFAAELSMMAPAVHYASMAELLCVPETAGCVIESGDDVLYSNTAHFPQQGA